MNTTTIGFNADTSCLVVGTGIISAALKAGVTALSFHSIMDKHYTTAQEFAKRLYDRVWMNSSGIKPKLIILNLAYAPWFMMSESEKADIPEKFKDAGEYSNRWPHYGLEYRNELIALFEALKSYPAMWDVIEFELGQEPSAPRYWWGSFRQYADMTAMKIQALMPYGKKPYGHHLPVSLLINPDKAINYYDAAANLNYYSTSFYEINSAGKFDYETDDIPPFVFKSILFPEVNYRASLKDKKATFLKEFHSPSQMAFYVRFLKWSHNEVVAHAEDKLHRIIFFTLYSCSTEADKGLFGYWCKNPKNGTYQKQPPPYNGIQVISPDGKYAWDHMVQFLSVVKDGWLPTEDGVVGANGKRIRIRQDGLSYVVE